MWALGAMLILYGVISFSIKVVRVLSPHDLDVFREKSTPSHARALRIAYQAPAMLNALGSARLLVQVLAVVALLHWYVGQRTVAVAGIWAVAGWIVASLGFATAFVLIHRGVPREPHATLWLPRMSRFILFWQQLFRTRTGVRPTLETSSPLANPAPPAPPTAMGDMLLYQNILAFDEAIVREIMQPRPRVMGIDAAWPFSEVLHIAQSSGFAAWPVYHEELDSIEGVLHIKDLVPHRQAPADFAWQTLVRSDYLTVAETKPLYDLLQLFKQRHQQVAVVVDEHGTTAGFVTLEDVLEEVTGDIPDEFATQTDTEYQRLDTSTFLFEGAALLNDVARWMGLAPDTFEEVRGDADTLAGLVLSLYGDIPKVGETLTWDRFLFTIRAATERRVERIEVRIAD